MEGLTGNLFFDIFKMPFYKESRRIYKELSLSRDNENVYLR